MLVLSLPKRKEPVLSISLRTIVYCWKIDHYVRLSRFKSISISGFCLSFLTWKMRIIVVPTHRLYCRVLRLYLAQSRNYMNIGYYLYYLPREVKFPDSSFKALSPWMMHEMYWLLLAFCFTFSRSSTDVLLSAETLNITATYSRFCLIRSGFPPVIIIYQDYARFAPFLVVVLSVVVVSTCVCVCVVGMSYGGAATLIGMFIFWWVSWWEISTDFYFYYGKSLKR